MCSASFVLCWLAPPGALALSGRQSRPSAVIPKAQEACVRVTHIDNQVGFGVLAAEPIEADQWICSYEGTLATDEECDARYPPGSRAKRRACGEGDYVFRLCEGLVCDAQNSTHFSRYFNHAENGTIFANISESERRIDFWALRRISAGEELTFDYGVHYWRGSDGPSASSDSRDYSAEGWAARDAEEAKLSNRFPLARGTKLPLTPLRPIELQAALTLPDVECRPALLRALDYFGAVRRGGGGGGNGDDVDDDDEPPMEISFGMGPAAPRRVLDASRVTVDELADAVAACIAQADLDGGGLADLHDCCTRSRVGGKGESDDGGSSSGDEAQQMSACEAQPRGEALIAWLARNRDELALIRAWRARVPKQASARHDAVALASYLLWKNPLGHGVTDPLPPGRVNALIGHLEAHRHEAEPWRAVHDVLAALAPHVERENDLIGLVDLLECWLKVSEGMVMG